MDELDLYPARSRLFFLLTAPFSYIEGTKRRSSDKAYIFPSWHNFKNLNFQIALMFLKLDSFCSKMCIENIKKGFKAIHHLQSRENLRFLLPPLILRL